MSTRRIGSNSFIRQFSVTALTVLGCVAVMAACTWVSMRISQMQGRQAVVVRSLASAGQVMRKADATALQIRQAIEQMLVPHEGGRCGPEAMRLMQKITINSSNLRAIARMEGDTLVCSTLGEFGVGVSLGPPVFISSNGLSVRTGVTFPGLDGQRFLVSERDGVATFAPHEMPLDIERVYQDVTLGTFSRTNGKAIRSRLPIPAEWVLSAASGQDSAVIHGDDVVVLHPSPHADYVAYVAVPAKLVRGDIQRAAKTTMPVGLLIGLLLCAALTMWIRRMTSMAAALNRALHSEDVFMLYQPIVVRASGRCVGAEALMRWQRDGKLVQPDHFIAA
ncbi:MAG: hypothetical protein JWP52_2792, partial [Rhizobacter sp.]|nr:hypothetical protein [Rhizobacter sp.]